MIISAAGIVIDHYGDVLFIQRNDTRTLAPPGGAAEINELPPDTVVREVKEETGLIVMPVRLVGLYYLPTKPNDYLTFCYRCILRGGELQTSEESPQAGFFKTNPYPKPMLPLSKERVQRSLVHQGGPPYWGTHQLSKSMRLGNLFLNSVIYPWFNLRQKLAGKEHYTPPAHWQIKVKLVIKDVYQRVLWIKNHDQDTWHIPGGPSLPKEPPWITANRISNKIFDTSIKLKDIKGIYNYQAKPEMLIIFEGVLSSPPPNNPNVAASFFVPGEEPEDAIDRHKQFIMDQQNSDLHYQLLEG